MDWTGRCARLAPEIIALVLLGATLPAQTGSKLVTMAVTVRERNGGKLVSNLTEHDFVIEEDGKPQPLARFTAERTPLSVAVVIDISQSLNGEPMKVTRAAARKFIETALGKDDEVALVSFNHAVTVVANWTTDRTKVVAGLDTLAPSGSTAMYDAVFRTLSLFTSRSNQRAAIVVISDGADSASDRTPTQLKKELAGTDLFLYWIAVDHADARPATRVNQYTIAEIAAQANGYSEVIPKTEDLDAALTRVSDELNHQYLMAYEPVTAANGKTHTVRVSVPKGNYVVRARREVLR
ncbi:MAG TPA: VWA domain-containing protein [Vicinamibacterales bacterium]|nr:VWA domain-containing protein [Vicinamibacterales bacterium]